MPELPNLPTNHQGGQAVGKLSASAVNCIMRLANELKADGAVVFTINADGSGGRMAVWMSEEDFAFRSSDNVVQTVGATGNTANGDYVVNGLVKFIGPGPA